MNARGASATTGDTFIVYDGECPFCSAYVRLVRLRESLGTVRIINAREGGAEVMRVRKAGFDLNDGMVFHYQGQYFHGADAMNMMALMSSGNSMFNRINALIFRHPRLSRILYPGLRAGRNAVLVLLGRSKLE